LKPLYVLALLLCVATAAFADGFAFGVVTSAPNQAHCNSHSSTIGVSCVSDAGSEGYAAISASPIANGLTFSETFRMGSIFNQSFGNVDLLTYANVTDPLPQLGFYTMTVLEQGTCTTNTAGACDGFGFQFSQYPPLGTGTFTSSPELETVTGSAFSSLGVFEAQVVSDHNTAANEDTTISGSIQIESVTFSPTLVPEPKGVSLIPAGIILALSYLASRARHAGLRGRRGSEGCSA
jgi:hypothetical protein